jgi:hypothetical protein
MLPSGAVIQAQELVTGLEGTGITVSFVEEPAAEVVGPQEVDLLFAMDGAECTRSVMLTRFQMVTEISTKMGSGDIPDIRDYIPNMHIEANFKGDSPASLPAESCGIHSLVVECDGREYPVTYLVTEDIPPVAEGLTVTAEAGSLPAPESLVDQIVDHSDVTVTYAEPPMVSTLGTQEVTLVLTDAFGIVAMVAMTPLIAIQVLGLYSEIKRKKLLAQARHEMLQLEDDMIYYEEVA